MLTFGQRNCRAKAEAPKGPPHPQLLTISHTSCDVGCQVWPSDSDIVCDHQAGPQVIYRQNTSRSIVKAVGVSLVINMFHPIWRLWCHVPGHRRIEHIDHRQSYIYFLMLMFLIHRIIKWAQLAIIDRVNDKRRISSTLSRRPQQCFMGWDNWPPFGQTERPQASGQPYAN